MEKAKNYISRKALSLFTTLKLKDSLTRLTIFQPPKESGYLLKERINEDNCDLLLKTDSNTIINLEIQNEWLEYKAYKLYTIRDGQAYMNPILHIKWKKPRTQQVIIYSHGNGSDISNVWNLCMGFSLAYCMDIVLYDYTGYGESPNKSSENQMYIDIQTVLAFVTNNLKYELTNVIIWGFSLGTCPSTYIASKYQNIRGLVLVAPLASILSWLSSNEQKIEEINNKNEQDLFDNLQYINQVEAKIMIIHGTNDNIVPIRHSHLLIDRYMDLRLHNIKIQFLPINDLEHNNIQKELLNFEEKHAVHVYKYIKKLSSETIQKTSTYDYEIQLLKSIKISLQNPSSNYLVI